MIELKKDGYYIIKADAAKSLIYVSYLGHWQSPDEVPMFKEDMLKATKAMNGKFDMVAVIDDLKPPNLVVQKLHREVQKIWIEGGLQRGAQIMPTARLVHKLAINVISKLSGLAEAVEIKIFKTVNEGLAWLGKPELQESL